MTSLWHHIRTITCRRDHGFWARNFDCERLFGNFCEGYVLIILCGFLLLKTIHSNIQLKRYYTTVIWNHIFRDTSTFVWIAWEDSCHGCIPRILSIFLGEGLSWRSNQRISGWRCLVLERWRCTGPSDTGPHTSGTHSSKGYRARQWLLLLLQWMVAAYRNRSCAAPISLS